MRIRPNNWHELQHYKDRNPVWIKLHRKLLDNYEFNNMSLASRALAPMLWLLASESTDGWIDGREGKLLFRLKGFSPKELRLGLKGLIAGEFFDVEQSASGALAGMEQHDSPERQVERQVERQEQTETRAREFEGFWKAYPRKVGKGAASEAYEKARKLSDSVTILSAAERFAKSRIGQEERFTPLPTTWLNQQRWNDELPGEAGSDAASKPVHPSWNGSQSKLVDEIGEGQFNAYFAETQFDAGPPVHIRVAKSFMRDAIERKFAGPLKRAFEEVLIEVAQ